MSDRRKKRSSMLLFITLMSLILSGILLDRVINLEHTVSIQKKDLYNNKTFGDHYYYKYMELIQSGTCRDQNKNYEVMG